MSLRRRGGLETSFSLAEQQPVFDFTEELLFALGHARSEFSTENGGTSLEHLKEIQEQYSQFANHPDTTIIRTCRRSVPPHHVVTNNPEAFPYLVEQAIRTIYTQRDLTEAQLDKQVAEAKVPMVEHGLKRAAIIHEVNPRVSIDYGIKILQLIDKEASELVIGSYVAADGWLRKIDFALIASGLSKSYESDIAIAHALGYKGTEEVRSRYTEVGCPSLFLNLLNAVNKGIKAIPQPLR